MKSLGGATIGLPKSIPLAHQVELRIVPVLVCAGIHHSLQVNVHSISPIDECLEDCTFEDPRYSDYGSGVFVGGYAQTVEPAVELPLHP